jgi:hypothetical protein
LDLIATRIIFRQYADNNGVGKNAKEFLPFRRYKRHTRSSYPNPRTAPKQALLVCNVAAPSTQSEPVPSPSTSHGSTRSLTVDVSALYRHAWLQKSLDQVTFAHQYESSKSLVPHSCGHIRVAIEPMFEFREICRRNPAFPKSIDEVVENAWGRRPPELKYSRTVYGKSNARADRLTAEVLPSQL